jgi:hypothetical protein
MINSILLLVGVIAVGNLLFIIATRFFSNKKYLRDLPLSEKLALENSRLAETENLIEPNNNWLNLDVSGVKMDNPQVTRFAPVQVRRQSTSPKPRNFTNTAEHFR